MSDSTLCLCGSEINQADCCVVFHSGTKAAPTAEALMRSRFTAYAMQNEIYLLETWDNNKRPDSVDFSKEGDVEWTSLNIISKKRAEKKTAKVLSNLKPTTL